VLGERPLLHSPGLLFLTLTLLLTLIFNRESKATIMRAAYGTAEAVPLQSLLPSATETDE
jgi:hypothetical protein